jgi:hypothetical protein
MSGFVFGVSMLVDKGVKAGGEKIKRLKGD